MANNNLREVLKKLIQKTLNWVKSNCVNNLLSTATNLPLAAAQGKVLDEKIGEVTQSLELVESTTLSNTKYLKSNVYMAKNGRTVEIIYTGDALKVDKGWVTLGIVPEEYRPKHDRFSYVRVTANSYIWVRIEVDGSLRYYSPIAYDYIVNFQFAMTYISAN